MTGLPYTSGFRFGIPNEGNDRTAWKAGARLDFDNPEYRS